MNWSGYAEFLELQKLDLRSAATDIEQTELQNFYQEYQQLIKEQEKLHAALQQHSGNQESARYYFYLENETRIQQLLDEKVTITRMLDEEQRIAVKLAQATAIPTNWREHPPRPFANEAAIQQLFVPLQNQQKELEEQKIRLGLVKEQRNQAEASLNDYEQKHPELFDKKKNPPWLFIAAGVSFILAFFSPIPLRYILIAAAIICGVGGTLKQNKPVNKDTWQEKLGQLDVYEGQVVEMTEKVTRSQQKVQHLSDQIQTELRHRNMSNAENEFAVVQENQRAQNYLAQLQTSKELQQRQSSLRQNLMQQEQRFEFLAEWLPLNQKNLSENAFSAGAICEGNGADSFCSNLSRKYSLTAAHFTKLKSSSNSF